MRKIITLIFTFVFLTSLLACPTIAQAETLGDLKNTLNKKQQEYKESEKQKQLTQEQINQTNSDIVQTKKNISQTYIDIANIEKEIDSLYEEIAKKKAQVKQVVNFEQVSSGESAYLEYVFGAESFTDLIYRSAISEQLADYNTKLVDEYNNLIEEARKKQEQISQKQVELSNYQVQLEQKVASLGQTLEAQTATSLDIQEEIKVQKEIIEMYENMGCKDNENIKTCGRSVLPPGTAFYRPLVSAHITSEWGTRYYGGRSFHEGLDHGVAEGTPAYAVGTGKVATVINRSSCGGNMVVVHHNIKGTTYTTVYAHLLSINVAKGQTVTRDTIVGYTGGQSTKSYDGCTGGAHLHLTVARGLYGVDYNSWTQMNYTYSINPRSVINYPSGSQYWYDRITAY